MNKPKTEIDPERLSKMTHGEKKILAKDMYFEYAQAPTIARTLEIKLPTLKTWIYGLNNKQSKGWKVERELAKNQLLKDLSSDKRGMVFNMVDGSLFLLHHFIEKKKIAVLKKDEPISIRDAEKITNMLQNLHKIVENDKDNDTNDDPNFNKPTSPKELAKRLSEADPFQSVKLKGKKNENLDDDDIIDVTDL